MFCLFLSNLVNIVFRVHRSLQLKPCWTKAQQTRGIKTVPNELQ